MTALEILPYRQRAASYHDWDARAPRVAALLIDALEASNRAVTVEHVGSTSVPGCAGKGIIDLMLIYPPGGLETARAALDEAGFQHQGGSDPFPEDRPMRVGEVRFEGEEFRIHVHVIAADSPEVEEFRAFRRALLGNDELMRAYMARKQEILASGVTEAHQYAVTKGAFCRAVLAEVLAENSTT